MKASGRFTLALGLALIAVLASVDPVKAGVVLDPNFHAPFFATPDLPGRVRLLPSGKFVVYFNVDTLTDQPTGAIARYLSDGALDPSFNFSQDYSFVEAAAQLPNGQLIIAAQRTIYGNAEGVEHILRLNADGSIDPTFNPAAMVSDSANPSNDLTAEVREIVIQADGKILLAGFFGSFQGMNYPGIVRLLADGTVDPSFAAVTLQFSAEGSGVWGKPAVQSDSKIIIVGDFSGVNNIPCPGVARLNSNGSVDSTFQASGFTRTGSNSSFAGIPARGLVLQSDGRIVIGGSFSSASGAVPIRRLNADGSVDTNYVLSPTFFASYPTRIRDAIIQPDGKVITVNATVARFNTDGTLDSTFRQPALLIDRTNTISGGTVEALTVNLQNDGKVLIGGNFTDVDDASGPPNGPRFGIARFNSNGTLDNLTTSHRTGLKATPSSFLRQPDGSTLIAFNQVSSFYNSNPAIPHNFGRLLPNGSLDPSFNPFPGYASNGALTPNFIAGGFRRFPDGKLLVAGTKSQGGSFTYGRLFFDGTEDTSFVPDPSFTSSNLGDPKFQPDGKTLIPSGSDSDAQSVVDNKLLQRLTAAGSIDASFNLDPQILAGTVQRDGLGQITTVATGKPNVLAVFADGSFLFSYFALDNTWRLVRLTRDGAMDNSFQGASIPFTGDALSNTVIDPLNPGAGPQPITELNASTRLFKDGQVVGGNKIVIVGEFASYGTSNTRGIVRINSSGSVDPAFQAGAGPQLIQTPNQDPTVRRVALEGDGRLLLIGEFDAFSGTTAPGIVSLNTDGSVDSQFVAPAIANKFDYHESSVEQQFDGSFLLSGPYTLPSSNLSPSFIRLLGPPVIISPLAATGTVGQQFIYQFETGGATSLGASNLPAGLTLNASLGAITGTPTTAGTFPVGLSASNAAGATNATLTITVQPAPPAGPVVTSSTSATGRVGQPFSFQVITTGGSPASRVSAAGLPPGLVIDEVTGLISGKPTAEGSSAVTLTVTDGNLTTTSVLQLTFTTDPKVPVIISSSSASLTPGQAFNYTIVAPATSDPSDVTTYTLVGPLPNGLSFDPTTGTISGTFTVNLQSSAESPDHITLSGGIVSNVQIFATNSHGTSTIPLNFFLAPTGAVNIATRLAVGTGNNVLIAGFIITGNAPKSVIIRAIGPSLPLPGTLPDPMLELHDSTGLLGSNDNWRDTQENEIIATTIPPTNDLESAILAVINPGNYTAIVKDKNNTPGIAVVEVYDLGTASPDTSSNAKLAQISTRGQVLKDDNVMIGGFILSGQPSKVIVRAIGPSLNGIVPGALQDPMLELHDSSGSTIFSNDDWRSTQEQEIIATTVPPKDDRESAIVATLNPGAYTAIVRGKGNTTGVALVEVYGL